MSTLSATNDASAGAIFQSTVQGTGLDISDLGQMAQLQLAVAELYVNAPPGSIAAGDIASGTFGANIPDTGTYTFPSQVNFGTKLQSTTALATPSALAATTFNAFPSTVSGAVLMGFGTTHDVALKNRAGTTVFGITASSANVTFAGDIDASMGGVNGLLFLSTNALATPSALAATGMDAFASTVSGGVLMGFGTTHDVALKNRAGTTALGVTANTLNVTLAGSALSTAPTGGLGYATGAGGAQTQATDKSTTVVSNTITTAITMNGAALNLLTIVAFTFTNSTIAATDTVICTHQSAGTSGAYTISAFPGAGSAVISVRNNTAGSLSEAIVIRVTVIKSVSA